MLRVLESIACLAFTTVWVPLRYRPRLNSASSVQLNRPNQADFALSTQSGRMWNWSLLLKPCWVSRKLRSGTAFAADSDGEFGSGSNSYSLAAWGLMRVIGMALFAKGVAT